MSERERELLQDLRELAVDGPCDAPLEVKQRLLKEFRKRSARRRRVAWLPVSGLGAIAATLLILLSIPRHHDRVAVNASTVQADMSGSVAADSDSDFYPLPAAEGLPPAENATVIRVQVPIESLQMMGLDINADPSYTGAVQADILLGEDGVARAVRFVE